MNKDWFWEGNVQSAIAQFLVSEGWSIRSAADTAIKEHGVDLVAVHGTRSLAIEVKGYPSTAYADPKRAHETKRTNPVNQASHWYAQALLKAMRLRSTMPNSEIAIGLPDFPRYRKLLQETEGSVRRIGIGVYIVAAPDAASLLIPHASRPAELRESFLPFDGYEGGGRRLLGIPAFGGGSSRRDYGVPVFQQCGWACAYCGVEMGDDYEAWLGLSVDHVVPMNLIKAQGYPREWIEDITNKVTCCRHCNEFLNAFRVIEPVPGSLDEFYDLRDRVFRDKRRLALQRHGAERSWYDESMRPRQGS